MSIRKITQTSFAAIVAAGLAAPASAEDNTIVLGQVGLSFYAVVGGVVQELLEAEGYKVEVVEGPHSEIFPQLGVGDVDMLAAAWLPSGHGSLFAPVAETTFEIAPVYDDAAFFWVVPSYVPEDMVSSIADLTDPEVIARMPETIVSLPEATGLTTGGRRVMEEYGLGDAGYELLAAPPAEWLATFTEAVENEEWVVFPLWQPQWVNAVHDVRPLEEPEGAYAAPDTAFLIGHDGLRQKLDAEAMALLEGVRFDVADVTEMDRMVNVDGMTPRAAAQAWMAENAQTVESWGAGS